MMAQPGLKLFREKESRQLSCLGRGDAGHEAGFEVAAMIRKEEAPEQHTIIVIMTGARPELLCFLKEFEVGQSTVISPNRCFPLKLSLQSQP